MSNLRGFTSVGEILLSEQLETNLKTWLDWGLLEKGGYFNVRIASSGAFGGRMDRLRLVEDPNYTKGKVWEGFRTDWVWESGVSYGEAPIRVSGVFVAGQFKPATGVGPYAHKINYPLGRVIFDSAINPSSVVTAEYSYRLYTVQTADCPWWRQVQFNSFRVDSSHFLQYGSGSWSTLGGNRLQLPAVIVESVPQTERTPYELGNLTQTVKQAVNLHVLTETPWDRKQMHDILTYQQEERLVGFDKNRMLDQGVYPLDEYGSPRPSGLMYPQLIKPTGEGGCGWRQIRIVDARSLDQGGILPPLYFCTVRYQAEVDLP